MKRFLFILALLSILIAAISAEEPFFAFGGSTAANATTDLDGYLIIDADQDVMLSFGPLALALNVGDTIDLEAETNNLSFGYVLSASQIFGPFTIYGSLESDALAVPLKPAGGELAGEWLKWIKAGADFAVEPVGINAYLLFSAAKGYPFFIGTELVASFLPAWGELYFGMTYEDAQAVIDDVGYKIAPRIIEGLSFFAKAKVSY